MHFRIENNSCLVNLRSNHKIDKQNYKTGNRHTAGYVRIISIHTIKISNKTTLFEYTIMKFQFNEYVFPLFLKLFFDKKPLFFSFFIPPSINHFQLIILNGSCVIFTRSTFLRIGTTNFIMSVC